MSQAAAVQKPNLLRDGRPLRALNAKVTQKQMFGLHGSEHFNPKTEGIARVRDLDDALNVSGIYKAVMGDVWTRTNEYAAYKKDPTASLGNEIVWVEGGVVYRKLIPDVPVKVGEREISLQEAVGMAVYDSICLLQIEQTDDTLFTVSVADPSVLTGKVRVVDFMRNGWAGTDEHSFPVGSKPVSDDDPAARFGYVRNEYDQKATGWHGSVARDVYVFLSRRTVYANVDWSNVSGVAIVGREAAAPQVSVPEEKLVEVADPKALVRRAEQLETTAHNFSDRFGELLSEASYKGLVTQTLETAKMLRELAGKIGAVQKKE